MHHQPIEPTTKGGADTGPASVVGVVAERYGCGATTPNQRRKCALFLWLLGPTTEQLAVDCPCRRS